MERRNFLKNLFAGGTIVAISPTVDITNHLPEKPIEAKVIKIISNQHAYDLMVFAYISISKDIGPFYSPNGYQEFGYTGTGSVCIERLIVKKPSDILNAFYDFNPCTFQIQVNESVLKCEGYITKVEYVSEFGGYLNIDIAVNSFSV